MFADLNLILKRDGHKLYNAYNSHGITSFYLSNYIKLSHFYYKLNWNSYYQFN